MTNRKKPAFAVTRSFWVNSSYLPDALRFDLLLELNRSALDYAQKEKLLTHANLIAQIPNDGDESVAKQSEELEKVISDCYRLRNSLNALSGSTIAILETRAREVASPDPESPPPITLSFEVAERLANIESLGILSDSWEWISGLEAAAEYALSQQQPSKGKKPPQVRARAMVAELARSHLLMTSKLPPADPAAWFAAFCGRLAEHLGLEAGSRIVESGIRRAKAPFFSEEEWEKLYSENDWMLSKLARVQSSEWARDDKATLGILSLMGEGRHMTTQAIAQWTDDEVREVEAYCLALHARATATDGSRGKVPPRPVVLRPGQKAPSR